MGAAFGAVIAQTAVAILVYFIAPTAWSLAGPALFKDNANWLDVFGAFGRIADSGKPCRYRVDGECAGLTVRHLGPAQRRRHPCVRTWSDRVRRRGRMVLGVLVVVYEHAVALFFPPLAGGNLGRTSFDFAGQGDRGAANFGERPPRRNPCVDVESARA